MKRILSLIVVLCTMLPTTAWGYVYNEPHSMQNILESSRMKTVSITIWHTERYPWSTTNTLLSSGTGTMIGNGLILTNAHVVEKGDITIKTYSGEIYNGTVIKSDPSIDLALVSFDSKSDGFTLSTVSLYKGMPVMTVGNPLGLPQWSFSEGRVQTPTLAYEGQQKDLYTGIQTDAEVKGGGSGGPLLDSAGELVGIVRASDGVYSYAVRLEDIKIFLEGINR